MAKSLNWDDPIGKYLSRNGKHYIIGVAKDFHFSSFHHKIEPLILTIEPWQNLISLKINDAKQKETITGIEHAWNKIINNEPFEYELLEKEIESNYHSEARFAESLLLFSFLAILIAGLGLFGQVSFNTEQRTREIGIRKVFGASIKKIVLVLLKDMVRIVVIANIVAWPIVWYITNIWLSSFETRIDTAYSIYLITLILSLAIALLTVLYQTYKAAVANPVDALKYE